MPVGGSGFERSGPRPPFRLKSLGYIQAMIVIGLVLLLLGFLLSIPVLWTLGIIVLIVGLVLLVLGSMNRQVGGRRHYW
jgi:uncharacterized membrane protein YczE